MNDDFVYCPVCQSKTRVRIRRDTKLENFPLHCPKCKIITLINAAEMKIQVITVPAAKTQSR
ncbi:MAG: cysteine-rich KTR domain-containing protein [Oscillospiraceae bacterium]